MPLPESRARAAGALGSEGAWERLSTNLRVQAELLTTLDLLDEFEPVVFKGPVLTQLIYGDLRARASADNDLFVPTARAHAALDRLLHAGYRALPELDPHAALDGAGQVALWPEGDLRRVSLDLHQRPFSRPYFEVDEALVLAHLEPFLLSGVRVTTFDRPLAFAHLVAHFVQHHLDPAHLPVIASAYDAWRPELEAAGVRELLAATGTLEAADYALSSAGELGLVRAAPPSWQTARARRVRRVWPPGRRSSPRYVVRRALSLYLVAPERWFRGALDSIFRRPDDLRSRYGAGARPWHVARHVLGVLTKR